MVAQSEQTQGVRRKSAKSPDGLQKRAYSALTAAQIEAITKAYVYDGKASKDIAAELKLLPAKVHQAVSEYGMVARRQAVWARREAGLAKAEIEAVQQSNAVHRDMASLLSFKSMSKALENFQNDAKDSQHAAIAAAAEKWVKIFRQAAGLGNGEVNVTQVNQTTMFLGGNASVPRGTISSSTVAPSVIEAEIVPEKPTDLGASPIGLDGF